MQWSKLFTNTLDRLEFTRAYNEGGSEAIHLWLGLRCWCADHEKTDGVIPADQIYECRGPKSKRTRNRIIGILVQCGILLSVEGGFFLPDHLESHGKWADIEAKRAKERKGSAGVSDKFGRSLDGVSDKFGKIDPKPISQDLNDSRHLHTKSEEDPPGIPRPRVEKIREEEISEKISEENSEERFAKRDFPHATSPAAPSGPAVAGPGELGSVVIEEPASLPSPKPLALSSTQEVVSPKKARQKAAKPSAKPKPLPHPDFRKVVDSYHRHFLAARGEKPAFSAMDGKAINTLLSALKSFEECDKLIASVFADKYWATKISIQMLARDPSRYKGLKSGPVYNPAKGSPLQQDGATEEQMLSWGFPEEMAKAEALKLKEAQDAQAKEVTNGS